LINHNQVFFSHLSVIVTQSSRKNNGKVTEKVMDYYLKNNESNNNSNEFFDNGKFFDLVTSNVNELFLKSNFSNLGLYTSYLSRNLNTRRS